MDSFNSIRDPQNVLGAVRIFKFDQQVLKDTVSLIDTNSMLKADVLDENGISLNVRSHDYFTLDGMDKFKDFYGKVMKDLIEHNHLYFHYNLEVAQDMQYLEYNGDRGDYYSWHSDYDPQTIDRPIRKLAYIIILSDPADYTGGELQFFEEDTTIKNLTYGDMILFPAFSRHRITPVTSGTLKMIVGWLGGSPFQ